MTTRARIASFSFRSVSRLPRSLATGAIGFYQAALSPILRAVSGPACRFQPTCSEYARLAIEEYGAIRGGSLAIKRLLRCHPFGGHGYDPIPAPHDDAENVSRT